MKQITPEELKKALMCCGVTPPKCKECPYDIKGRIDCKGITAFDALAYIKQLENHFREVAKKVEQLERERDAAINELRGYGCEQCAHSDLKNIAAICRNCELGSLWQWHGVKEELKP